MPYYPPAPTPEALFEAWPREYQEITIPLSSRHGAVLSIPKVMTRMEWERLLEFLALVESVVVEP